MRYIIIFSLLFSSSSWSEQPKGAPLVKYIGEFYYLAPQDKRNLYGFEYYFVLEEEGKPHAYPVEASPELIQKIKNQTNRLAFVKAHVRPKSIETKERTKQIAILKVEDVKFLKLSALSPSPENYSPKSIQLTDKIQIPRADEGLLKVNGINDTVTNTLIFAGGAALIGSMFLKK